MSNQENQLHVNTINLIRTIYSYLQFYTLSGDIFVFVGNLPLSLNFNFNNMKHMIYRYVNHDKWPVIDNLERFQGNVKSISPATCFENTGSDKKYSGSVNIFELTECGKVLTFYIEFEEDNIEDGGDEIF